MIPPPIARYLKSYDLDRLDPDDPRDLYFIALEVLTKGDAADRAWPFERMRAEKLRSLFRERAGLGMSEEQCQRVREILGLSTEDIPLRDSFGWWACPRRCPDLRLGNVA